jgi:hypothetical protein
MAELSEKIDSIEDIIKTFKEMPLPSVQEIQNIIMKREHEAIEKMIDDLSGEWEGGNMRYPKANKRIRIRGQNKLIKEAPLALRWLRKVQPSFANAEYLLHAIRKVERIEASLIAGKYTNPDTEHLN